MESNLAAKTEAEVFSEMGKVPRPDANSDIQGLNIPVDAVAFHMTLFLNDGTVRNVWNGMDSQKQQFIFNTMLEEYLRASTRNEAMIIATVKMYQEAIDKERKDVDDAKQLALDFPKEDVSPNT